MGSDLRALLVVAGLLGIGAFPFPGQASGSGLDPIPCSDVRGCPNLVVDDLKLADNAHQTEHWNAHDCAVQEGATRQGERVLLRFTFSSPNIGNGSLIVGGPLENPDYFVWDSCHGHYHFVEYADYRLWTIQGYKEWDEKRNEDPDKTAQQVFRENPRLRQHFVAGHKQGFCVMDSTPTPVTKHGLVLDPDPPSFTDCSDNQGISRGWADVYPGALDGQWVDVTHVEPGIYVLEAEVNTERLYEEESYADNRAASPVQIGIEKPGPIKHRNLVRIHS